MASKQARIQALPRSPRPRHWRRSAITGFTFSTRIVIDGEGVRKLYELSSMPMTLSIDHSNKIAGSYIGVVDKAACESKLRTLLEEKSLKAAK